MEKEKDEEVDKEKELKVEEVEEEEGRRIGKKLDLERIILNTLTS